MQNSIMLEIERLKKIYGTSNPYELIDALNIHLILKDNLGKLKGFYYVAMRERYIVINDSLSERDKLLVAGHELGHDRLHQNLAKVAPLKDFMLYDMTSHAEYEAKVFRLKEMAKTVLYLQENNFADLSELQTAADSASERYHDLSKRIKDAETRMAKIAVLKTHIINYSKTREVFAGYKAAKYPKAYLDQHESDILLHRAAKKAFNELGLKKLPTVKCLQQEYGNLMSEKKAMYTDYKKTRDEMRELTTVKANVSYILGADGHNSEQEKEMRSQ